MICQVEKKKKANFFQKKAEKTVSPYDSARKFGF